MDDFHLFLIIFNNKNIYQLCPIINKRAIWLLCSKSNQENKDNSGFLWPCSLQEGSRDHE